MNTLLTILAVVSQTMFSAPQVSQEHREPTSLQHVLASACEVQSHEKCAIYYEESGRWSIFPYSEVPGGAP
jgi:hypothetical protein